MELFTKSYMVVMGCRNGALPDIIDSIARLVEALDIPLIIVFLVCAGYADSIPKV